MNSCLLLPIIFCGVVVTSYAAVSNQTHFTFDDNAAPAGITVETGTPTYSGGQLHLDGNTWISSPSGISGTDNYGFEVVTTATSFDAAYDFLATLTSSGNTNTGVGVFQSAGNWSCILQGVTSFGSSSGSTGTEVHLAFVRDGGVNKFYVNGILIASNSGNVANGGDVSTLNLGANRSDANLTNPGANLAIYHGSINEIRTFTFTAGGFSATDLTAPTATFMSVADFSGSVTDNGAVDTTLDTNYGLSKVGDGINADTSLYLTKTITTLGASSPPSLILDLGADRSLASVALWAYLSSQNNNAVKDFGLKFATASEGTSNFGSSIIYNPLFEATQQTNADQQTFNFSETVTARYVKVTLLTNHGGNRFGLSEIQLAAIADASATPSNPSIVPIHRLGESAWASRYNAQLTAVQTNPASYDLAFIGDSITQGWIERFPALYNQYYASRNPLNLGIFGDETQHILWRLQHGHFEGVSPTAVVLLIGTNNTLANDAPAAETAAGIQAIIREIALRSPSTRILLLNVFPLDANGSSARRQKNDAINAIISGFADNERVYHLDINPSFLVPGTDTLLTSVFISDLIHLNASGYTEWYNAMEPTVKKLFGEIDSGVDADADSIDDGWEILHFGNMTTASASSNQDGDTHTDLDEFRFLTDPTDASDFATLNLDNSQLKFSTVMGISYRLQSSANLDDWTDQGNVIVGDGTEQILLTIPSNPSSLFYRVRIN